MGLGIKDSTFYLEQYSTYLEQYVSYLVLPGAFAYNSKFKTDENVYLVYAGYRAEKSEFDSDRGLGEYPGLKSIECKFYIRGKEIKF